MPAPTIGTASAIVAARPLVHPGYVAARWYNPFVGIRLGQTGVLPTGSIFLQPILVVQSGAVSALGARVAAVAASGNFQLGLYATDPVTKRPIGAALGSTGSLSTAVAAAVSGTVTAFNVQPGWYYLGTTTDTNGAAANFTGISVDSVWSAGLIGTATLANISTAATQNPLGYSYPNTFGTWPTIVPGTVTEGNQPMPIGYIQVSSVGA